MNRFDRMGARLFAVSLLAIAVGCGDKPDSANRGNAGGGSAGANPEARQSTSSPAPGSVLELKMSSQSPHNVGRFRPESGGHLQSSKGEAGALHYGPYVALAPGTYRAQFRLKAKGEVAEAGRVDVNVFQEGKPETVLGSAPLAAETEGQAKTVTVEFLARGGERHEFRVFVTGKADVELYGITVARP